MIIGEYKCAWRAVGFSYAEVVLFKRRNFFNLFCYWKEVHHDSTGLDDRPTPYLCAKAMHPDEMEAWFRHVIGLYEAYINAWSAR